MRPLVLGRLERGWIVTSETAALDIVGADRIMMGSDMPFPIGDPAPMKIVEETTFSDAERAAINGGLAQRLFGL